MTTYGRGDVVRVELPRPSDERGQVQSGTRPAVIIHSDDGLDEVPVVLIVPGTSKQRALRFQYTTPVDQSAENGLREKTVFLGFQIQAADKRWVRARLGTLSEPDLQAVEDAVLGALGFDPPRTDGSAPAAPAPLPDPTSADPAPHS